MKDFGLNSLLLVFFFSLAFSSSAQITFQKTFGGNQSTFGYSVQQTTDGGYIMTGLTSFGAGNEDVYLIKTDSHGNTLWKKTYGGIDSDCGFSVQQTADGGYIIVGYSESFTGGTSDVYLIKSDANGNQIWTKTFGGSRNDQGNSLHQTSDGGYIIAGSTNSFFNQAFDTHLYLIKTDSNGDSLWTRTFGATDDIHCGSSVLESADGGYVTCGIFFSRTSLLKIDVQGNLIWNKTFGILGCSIVSSFLQFANGGYIITGSVSFGPGNVDVYLIKTDTIGNVLWTKTFGGSHDDYGQSVQQTSDNGYIIAGYTNSFGTGNFDTYLIKTDVNGDTLWTKIIGGSGNDLGYSVHQTFDDGFIILGQSQSFGFGNTDFYLTKTDANGFSGCNEGNTTTTIVNIAVAFAAIPDTSIAHPNTIVTNPSTVIGSWGIDSVICTSVGIHELNKEESFIISPNPASSTFTIHSDAQLQNAQLEIYNLIGEKAGSWRFSNGKEEITIDVSGLNPGLYVVKVQSVKGTLVQKIVIQ